VLALNKCNITSWAAVQLLEPLLPNLEELCLAANSLCDLPNTTTAIMGDGSGPSESVLQFASIATESYGALLEDLLSFSSVYCYCHLSIHAID
jgi:Leucine-rich repeat (LRR) protein